ncbi:hypothetical protein QBC38DRAFT_482080 [Podospora fimiseda]|uniref:Uncharacterized protein n=1 Tax=Podospora fimiseda TaxID=252190 RepID=A0AAN7BM35_9PEZI|nr:hypothetical protein QBC38DRAFT_482080 [Podospora fimiseda]
MSVPSSPTPLQPMSHNSQRDRDSTLFSPSHRGRGLTLGSIADNGRDSSVHEKINQFNSLAVQSKQLERKTADAALKRAMLGREEAEAEMRRYRDEARSLRKLVEEGKERERKVGERLETVMESYGRAKETHEHTKELWEKEIRRARKETFKTQSAFVKLQEELKASRMAKQSADEELRREKQLSAERAQEAFTAKYQLVGLQEQLGKAQEQLKTLEQEREALKKLVESHEKEIKRINSETKPPASPAPALEDQTTPSRKRQRTNSLNSANSDVADFEELVRLYQWEKQRADRAVQQVQFLETECHLKVCPAAKALRRSSQKSSRRSSPRRKRMSLFKMGDASDALILKDTPLMSPEPRVPTPKRSKTDLLREETEPRPSAIFVPSEGIFRTVSSQAEAAAGLIKSVPSPHPSPTDPNTNSPAMPSDNHPAYWRTPSIDPPDFALVDKDRTSLMSLLDAPHRESGPTPVFNIPTTPGPDPGVQAWKEPEREVAPITKSIISSYREASVSISEPISSTQQPIEPPITRPHTTASFYGNNNGRVKPTLTRITTTTKVPLREETDDPSLAQRIMKQQRTPAKIVGGETGEWGDGPSFDVNNPALTPTMTREEALEQIRERRVRARSVGRNASGETTGSSGRVTPGANSGRITPGAGSGRVTPGVGSGRVTPGGRRDVGGDRGRQREVSTQSAPTFGQANRGQSKMGVRRVRS